MRGKDPALTGQKLLVVACGLRARLGALLSGALVEAETRKGAGGFSGGETGSGTRDHFDQRSSDRDGARTPEDEEALLQDLPPLLLMARRAWLEGGELGGSTELDRRRGVGGGSGEGRRGRRQWDRGHAEGVDWAKEAEDLSVDLAEFMLQSIG